MGTEKFTRAYVKTFGRADKVVQIEDYLPSELAPEMVRIKMCYSAINPSDLITISGAYKSRTLLPFVPGFEGVGRIDEIKEEMSCLPVNQLILPLGGTGAWQTSRDVEKKWYFTLPDFISARQAATGYINPMTAFLIMTEKLIKKENLRLVINAANSATGQMLIRIANRMGIYPFAIVRNRPDNEFYNHCTVQQTILSEETNYHNQLIKLKNSGGVDAVLDCVGGEDAIYTAGMLKPGGQFIHYGLLSGRSIPVEFWKTRPDINFSYFHLRNWIYNSNKLLIQEKLNTVMQLIKEGTIYTKIAEITELRHLPRILNAIIEGKIKGKILVKL